LCSTSRSTFWLAGLGGVGGPEVASARDIGLLPA
jgi:hypothetical protein